ncbi:putative adenylosuccinate synthetase [Cardiosporidium cionae]|uniref:Adenylosuccinate synthetase n=1 Tax=Cardiosporidium cionae TaxID=476202 RepID=A0ABQ7JAB6_9APIC|nr:putative adenylosuccinate synthetase [Cardiosporidium cionae]|eukprot:KAF8820948.1 putative adenylosuccinate synthetase [Cardiosporidium cionae]
MMRTQSEACGHDAGKLGQLEGQTSLITPLPPIVLILGAQWGDEGKGKLVDQLASSTDICARFNGGSNAGHTIVVDNVKYALHLLPCGVLYPGTRNLIGNGVVLHLKTLVSEIQSLESRNPDILKQVFISTRTHLLFDAHQYLDAYQEKCRSGNGESLGTTKRGIGPCYTTKSARFGIRVADLFDWPLFVSKYRVLVGELLKMGDFEIDMEDEIERHRHYFEFIKGQVVDSVAFMQEALKKQNSILIEVLHFALMRVQHVWIEWAGANATMLDIDFGTYPYVTSSCTTFGGASIGLGLPPKHIDYCIAVVKAYVTRVGEGPFPTELADEIGNHLRVCGHEYGTTTQRPRRCGWLDIPLLRYSHAINGFNAINLTKLDVLSGLKEIKICTKYRRKDTGDFYPDFFFPVSAIEFENTEPFYESYHGWEKQLKDCKVLADLPENARKYIQVIEFLMGIPVRWVGVGPSRENTILLDSGIGQTP